MTNKIDKNKVEDGLPLVAQDQNRKNPFILVLVIMVLVFILGNYLYKKAEIKPQKLIEETYSISSESRFDEQKNQLVTDERKGGASTSNAKVNSELVTQQLAFIEGKQKELQQRLSAPLMLVNVNASTKVSGFSQQEPATAKDDNSLSMAQASISGSEASVLGPLNFVIAQGGLIHAILESATDSGLPGYLRASVSEPVYSEDGSQVLIPRGSRLIGQYKSGILQGQSRIFIVWTRLITPAGISLNLGSPGVDPLGVAGMGADEINRHFWERFGSASLLSLIGAGNSIVGVKGKDKENSISAYREGIASSFSQSASQSLRQDSMIGPTLKTYQGKSIMVFIAKDLNFQAAVKMSNPKINIF